MEAITASAENIIKPTKSAWSLQLLKFSLRQGHPLDFSAGTGWNAELAATETAHHAAMPDESHPRHPHPTAKQSHVTRGNCYLRWRAVQVAFTLYLEHLKNK